MTLLPAGKCGKSDPTLGTPLLLPPLLVATAAGATTIQLAWTDNSNYRFWGVVYEIFVGTTANNLLYRTELSVAAPATYQVTGLTANTTYYFQIRNRSNNQREASNVVSATPSGGGSGGTGTLSYHDGSVNLNADPQNLFFQAAFPPRTGCSGGSYLMIDGRWPGNSTRGIQFTINGNTPGTYRLGPSECSLVFGILPDDRTFSSFIPPASGSVVITSISQTSISGTYSFTASSPTTTTVASGSFTNVPRR